MLWTQLAELQAKLPRAATEQWPEGVPFIEALRHGTMSVEVFAPRGYDHQTAHEQDELYLVASGRARFECAGQWQEASAGTAIFVPAGADHRFHDMSDDFVTWVIFWGPAGGE